MSGELTPSMFRWSTTANRDFVIGDPSDNGTNPRFLVFQVNNTPGYDTNPHIRAEHNGAAWALKWSSDGTSLSSFALTDQNNTWSGINIFNGNSILGASSSNTLLVNANATFAHDLTINGILTASGGLYLNVTDFKTADKLLTLNKGGAAVSASGAGIEIEENSVISSYLSTSSDRNSWLMKAPNKGGILTFSPTGSDTSLIFTSSTTRTVTFPDKTGTVAMLSDIGNITITANKVAVGDSSGNIVASSLDSSKLAYLSDVTSNLQAQISVKASNTAGVFSTSVTSPIVNTDILYPKTSSIVIGDTNPTTYGTQSVRVYPHLTTNGITATTISGTTITGTSFVGNLANGTDGGYLAGKLLPAAAPGVSDDGKALVYNHSTGKFIWSAPTVSLPSNIVYLDTTQSITGTKTFESGIIIKDSVNSNKYSLTFVSGVLTISLV